MTTIRQRGEYSPRIDPEEAFEALREFPNCKTGIRIVEILETVDKSPEQAPRMAALLATRAKKNRSRALIIALENIVEWEALADRPRLTTFEKRVPLRIRKYVENPKRIRSRKEPPLSEIPYTFYVVNI